MDGGIGRVLGPMCSVFGGPALGARNEEKAEGDERRRLIYRVRGVGAAGRWEVSWGREVRGGPNKCLISGETVATGRRCVPRAGVDS